MIWKVKHTEKLMFFSCSERLERNPFMSVSSSHDHWALYITITYSIPVRKMPQSAVLYFWCSYEALEINSRHLMRALCFLHILWFAWVCFVLTFISSSQICLPFCKFICVIFAGAYLKYYQMHRETPCKKKLKRTRYHITLNLTFEYEFVRLFSCN